MKVLNSSIIYENPLPQLKSRHSLFPNLCQLPDGTVLVCHTIGEAFESVDGTSYISRSFDGGSTFGQARPMFAKRNQIEPRSDTCKITNLGKGKLAAIGYAFDRSNPELPIGNPETGGLLDDIIFISFSYDNGYTWGEWQTIESSWGPHAEASAPLTVLSNGSWVTPITGFSNWDGNITGRNCGRLLRSDDEGRTWSDNTICMAFEGDGITCFEQRLCQLESGAVILIGWNEDIKTGNQLPNHFTISYDNAETFSYPKSTGITGQASSVLAIGGEKVLSLHAIRKNTNRPGIYAYITNLSNGTWDIEEELVVWEPSAPITKNKKMAEIFSYLKFGQPSSILLSGGTVMMCHWYEENGQYKTAATRIEL